MPQLVATGQITIVDNNDAKPITGYITAAPGTQQVYTDEDNIVTHVPDWTAGAGMLLTAKIFAGGVGAAIDISAQISNPRWTTNLATAIIGTGAVVSGNAQLSPYFGAGTFTAVATVGTQPTLRVDANLLPTISQVVVYFDGDYTDPTTGLTSRVVVQISLSIVKTGTNAVYILTRGSTAIEQSTGATKTVAVVAADLIRAAGVDSTGVTFRWFENNGATQIITGAPFSTKYGLKVSTPLLGPTGSQADIGVGLPASGAQSGNNTLVIDESAVSDIGIYRVEVRDAANTVYQTFFTIYDVSDPYQVNIVSSSGDKLQNGVGSTDMTPVVYYGSALIASLTGWAFQWTFYNREGKRGAFIDTTKTALAGGRDITANTLGVGGTVTYTGATIAFAAGDIIKLVSAAGEDRYYEVASSVGNVVTLRGAVTQTWLTAVYAVLTTSYFVGGKLFACVGAFGQRNTVAGASITLTGEEVDIKARINCDAIRP